jgi:LacI family transcriptional regulator
MKTTKYKDFTMGDVAQKAGVSITTVSHVINKTRHVSEETKSAVLRAIKELNYLAPKTKTNNGHSGLYIGVILADAREDYYVAMIKSLESAARDYDISVIFCDSEVDFEREEKNIRTLLDRNVSGLLLAPVAADRMPGVLRKMSIPVILIDRQYDSHNFLFVGINNFRSSYQGTWFLFEKGCKTIGFIGYGDSVYTIKQRKLGCQAALAEADSPAPKILSLSYNKEDSYPLIKQFIVGEDLDGLLCATSSICFEVIEVLDTLDSSIQKRLKVLSYDDNRWFDYLKYPVSVISQPVAEMSNTAVENLLHFIEQKNVYFDVKRELLFETGLIDRGK